MDRWYVCQTKPSQEIRARTAISELGFQTFFPHIVKTIRRTRKPEDVIKPFYPGYVFALFDAEDPSWGKILYARGVSTILGIRLSSHLPMAGRSANRQSNVIIMARPIPLPNGVVEHIRGKLAERATEEEARRKVAEEPLKKNTKVKIIGGPFAGWDALVHEDERTRVRVLLDILGKQTTTSIPRDLITLPT